MNSMSKEFDSRFTLALILTSGLWVGLTLLTVRSFWPELAESPLRGAGSGASTESVIALEILAVLRRPLCGHGPLQRFSQYH